MKKAIRGALPFALMMIPIAAVGGWFTGSYAFASYTAQTQAESHGVMKSGGFN